METKSRLFNDTPHLLFQVHDTQVDTCLDIPTQDAQMLKELAKQYAQVAALPIQRQRMEQWRDINSLRPNKPLIWMNEICWHEMNTNGELDILCQSPLAQRIEGELRKNLYQWNHMQGDMILEPVLYSPIILENTGIGVTVEADLRESDKNSTIASRSFHNQFQYEEDLEKLKMPELTYHENRTRDFYQVYKNLFDGILPVEIRGCHGFWFAPWDDIVFWMNATNVLSNLTEKPELMHKLVSKLVDMYIAVLDQMIKLNLLARNDCNVRIGSGAYGYVDDLPGKDYNPHNVRTVDMWGSATPQIFAVVSPQMHDEFGLQYEFKWLSRFGLNYYGCCESVDGKMDVLEKIPNLRKISVSPWSNTAVAAERMKGKYVVSLKPSPSVLAFDTFSPELVEKELREKLEQTKGCCVEIVLKDISTVRYDYKRLWEWTDIATRVAREFE